MYRDNENLSVHKKELPLLQKIPDEEFSYIDGKWYLSLKGTKLLAFHQKRPDFIKFLNEVEKDAKQ